MRNLTNEQLGQEWTYKFNWYLIEMKEGCVVLSDKMHARLVANLRELDAEMTRRGLPPRERYVDAFEKRELLPEEDMKELSVEAYGQPVKFVGLEGR